MLVKVVSDLPAGGAHSQEGCHSRQQSAGHASHPPRQLSEPRPLRANVLVYSAPVLACRLLPGTVQPCCSHLGLKHVFCLLPLPLEKL